MLEQIAAVLPPFPLGLIPIAAVLLGGLLRGFVGFGGALVVIPMVALVYDPKVAVVVHALMEIPGILQLLPDALRNCARATVVPMALALVAMLPVGMFVLVSVDPDIMRVVLSVAVLAMVAVMASNWRYRGPVGRPVTLGAGAVGGLVQGATGVGGPPIVAILLSRNDPVSTTRGNVLMMMGLLSLASLPVQWSYGLVTAEVLWLGLLTGPLYVLATFVGSRFFNRGGSRFYRVGALAILAVTALSTLIASIA